MIELTCTGATYNTPTGDGDPAPWLELEFNGICGGQDGHQTLTMRVKIEGGRLLLIKPHDKWGDWTALDAGRVCQAECQYYSHQVREAIFNAIHAELVTLTSWIGCNPKHTEVCQMGLEFDCHLKLEVAYTATIKAKVAERLEAVGQAPRKRPAPSARTRK